MDIREKLKDIPERDILNLIINYKETKEIYLIRKESGLTFKQFRLQVKGAYRDKLNIVVDTTQQKMIR